MLQSNQILSERSAIPRRNASIVDACVALSEAVAVVCASWRYGDVLGEAPHLRAIINVSGGFPDTLEYQHWFARKKHVLLAA